MAIDPNISLQVRAPEPVDLMGSRMKAMNLRQLTQQGQVRDLQIEEEKQQQADRANQRAGQAAFSELLAKNARPDGGVDSYAVEKGLAERGYGQMAVTYGSQRRAESKVQLENVKTQLANQKQKLEMVGAMAGGVLALPPEQQPEAYARARMQMVQDGLVKPEEMPEQFDPGFVAQGRMQSIEASKQIDQAQKDADYQLRLDQFKEETKQKAPKSAQEWTALAGQIIGATDASDPEHVAEAKKTLEYLGAPKPVMALFNNLTPAQATAAGMTAEQRTTAAGQAEQRRISEEGNKMQADSAEKTRQVQMRGQNIQARANAIASTSSGIQRENALRDDFMKESKNFVAMRDAYGKIKQAAASDTAAADIALIYGFMRVLDPTSTVREGEFATAQNAGSIPDRVLAAYNKAITGGRLTPAIRADFVKESEKIYGQAKADHGKTREFYGGVAKRYGMEPGQVLPELSSTVGEDGVTGPSSSQKAPATTKKFSEFIQGPKGETLGWDGKKWMAVNGGAK